MMYDYLREARRQQYVERLSSSYKIRPYSNGIHQYYVGLMFINFAAEENVEINVEVIHKVLSHDFMEIYTGDLLGPAKHLNKKTEDLWHDLEEEVANSIEILNGFSEKKFRACFNDEQWRLFKVCDVLELLCFCHEEKALGNRSSENEDVILNCEKDLYRRCFSGGKIFNSPVNFYAHFKAHI